jgi:hypothetical protein
MKLKITTEEEIEVDISFPCYRKLYNKYYYLLRYIEGEIKVQQVVTIDYPEINTINFDNRILKNIEITQLEYETAFNLALSKLNNFAFPNFKEV